MATKKVGPRRDVAKTRKAGGSVWGGGKKRKRRDGRTR